MSTKRPQLDNQGLPLDWNFKPDLEITPRQARDLLADTESGFVLIDCREEPEWNLCRVEGSVWIPQGALIAEIDDLEIDPEQKVGVICHHGRRSMQAATLLRSLGYDNAYSVAGGIELWSHDVDPSIPRYEREGSTVKKVSPSQ